VAFTQSQLDGFWWGTGGSAANIQPGAYVLKHMDEVRALTDPRSPVYDAAWAALCAYCYQNKLYGWQDYVMNDPSSGNKFWGGAPSIGGNGPTKS